MKKTAIAFGALVALSSLPLHAETVSDLSGWLVEGDGTWAYNGDQNSWYQSENTPEASYLYDPTGESLGKAISGSITVTGSDDDMIGFVVGYDSGEYASSDANYLLMSWKGLNQNGWLEGMRLWHITDAMTLEETRSRGDNVWDPGTNSGMTLLDTATNLGSTGWVKNESYTFDIAYNGSYLAIFVNDELEMSIAPGDAGLETFEEGSFGFYNFSQGGVTYGSVIYDDVDVLINGEKFANLANAVPFEGAGLATLAALGFAGFRRKKQ